MNINSIITESHEFEGFFYISYEGTFFKGCRRCGGTGHYSFNGQDSFCYLCGNTSAKLGDAFENEAAAQKWCHERAVRKAQADRKREALRLAEVAKLDAKVAALPEDVRTFLQGVEFNEFKSEEDYYAGIKDPAYEKSTFIRSMAEHVQYVTLAGKPFTERMVEAVRKEIAKRSTQATEAAAHPAPAGRVAVTGEIVSARIVEGDYGTTYKMLVKSDEGFKVWGTVPSAQVTEFFQTVDYTDIVESLKGRRITFTATLTPSDDDVSFAFASRPTKGAWL